MITIWKFPLVMADLQEIRMPHGAEIRSLQAQYGEPQLWAEVDTEQKMIYRRFRMFRTGYPITKSQSEILDFVGTFQTGNFVFHVYESR